MRGIKDILKSQSKGRIAATAISFCLLTSAPASAQTQDAGGKAPRTNATVTKTEQESAAARQEEDVMAKTLINRFSQTYRLGPSDELSIRVKGQPEYSLEKARVSPTGAVYHPLLGDVQVAGSTIEQVKKILTKELSEYVLDPVVSIELLEAQSAKVGVIGEVKAPRIVVMSRPMTVLDAITEAGGFTDFGKKSNVTLLRQKMDGTKMKMTVNVDNILKGKADAEENLPLQAGDLLIVHGNVMKALPVIATMTSFTGILSFLSLGARR